MLHFLKIRIEQNLLNNPIPVLKFFRKDVRLLKRNLGDYNDHNLDDLYQFVLQQPIYIKVRTECSQHPNLAVSITE